MQTSDILTLANNNFAKTKEKAIKLNKIVIKDKEYLTYAYRQKLNGI